MGKFGQILINIVIMDYFRCQNNSFFILKKLGKFQEIFGKFWEIFRKKLPDIKLQISEIFKNSFLKTQ